MLEKLTDSLETLRDEEFSMVAWARKTDCGTVCCAFGWAPKFFPELFYWSWNGNVGAVETHTNQSAHSVLSLTLTEYMYLFVPLGVRYGDITLKDQILRMRHFIKMKKAGYMVDSPSYNANFIMETK